MNLPRVVAAMAIGILLASVPLAACGGSEPSSGTRGSGATDAGSPSSLDPAMTADGSLVPEGAAPNSSDGAGGAPGSRTDASLEAIARVDACTLPSPAYAVAARQNVKYVAGGGTEQVLDVGYPTPVASTPAHPIVLFVHGGGWVAGDKGIDDGAAGYLAQLGYVAASTSYRLASMDAGANPSNTFPAQIQDVRCALRWLRKNASSLGADPTRVAVVGESAGGHLAALLGTTPNETSFDGACPELGTDPAGVRVNAVVDVYGPADLRRSSDYPPAIAALVADFLGGAPEAVPAKAALASPITHLGLSTPPHLILHGTTDQIVPVAISDRYFAALRASGVPSTLVELPGVGHAFSELATTPPYAPTTCTFLAFLKDRLRP